MPDFIREVPDVIHEVPNLFNDVPHLPREVLGLESRTPDFIDEASDLTEEIQLFNAEVPDVITGSPKPITAILAAARGNKWHPNNTAACCGATAMATR